MLNLFNQIQNNSPFGWILGYDYFENIDTRLCVAEVKAKKTAKKFTRQHVDAIQSYLSEHIFTWFDSVAEDSTDPIIGKSGFAFMNPVTFCDYVAGYGRIVQMNDKAKQARGNAADIGDTKIFVTYNMDNGVVYLLPDPNQVAKVNLGFHLESEDKGWVTITTGIRIEPVEKPIVKKYRVVPPWQT